MSTVQLVFLCAAYLLVSSQTLPPDRQASQFVIQGDTDVNGTCPDLTDHRSNTRSAVLELLRDYEASQIPETIQVVDINMSDPSQQCPFPWIETLVGGVRYCFANRSRCTGVVFPVGLMYSRVSGQAVGHTAHSPDAFFSFNNFTYLDGISVITHGPSCQHIWSFAAGIGGPYRCPCDNADQSFAPLPPTFVGDNYFCDSIANGALWDGRDCTTACCTFNSPPWFNVTLPTLISEDIEVSICTDMDPTDELIYISLLQLFVQL